MEKLPEFGQKIIIYNGNQICYYGGLDIETRIPFARPIVHGILGGGVFFKKWRYPTNLEWFDIPALYNISCIDNCAGNGASKSPAA